MLRVLSGLVLPLLAAALAGCATPAPQELRPVYSDDGHSELRVPAGWASRADLGRAATLRVADGVADSYLMVHTYQPDEVDNERLAGFARRVSEAIREHMRDGRLSGPRALTVGGRAAVEYEVAGYLGDTGIVYQSTVVEGERARFHHLIGWTTVERYSASRDTLRAIAATFRESPQPRAPKVRVDLTFDWPRRLEARTDYYSRKDKGTESFELRASGRMTVQPHGADRLLVRSHVTRHRLTPAVRDPGKAQYLQRLLAEAMTGVPDYVITTGGDFVQVENLGAYHRRIEHALLQGLPGGPGAARAKAQQLVLSAEVLAASMEDEWNSAVGAWAGGSYVPGETYAFTTQYRAPALGDDVFPMSVTQRLSGRVPCHARTRTRTCVRLVQTSRVAGPAFTKATHRVVSRAVGGDAEVENVEVVKELVVVTDPETLLPHQVRSKETKHIAVRAGGKSHTSREVQESRTLYAYPN